MSVLIALCLLLLFIDIPFLHKKCVITVNLFFHMYTGGSLCIALLNLFFTILLGFLMSELVMEKYVSSYED